MSDASSRRLTNQSVVRFQSGAVAGQAYSNVLYTPVSGPRITVDKQAAEPEAELGRPLTYVLTVRNEGSLAAVVTLYDVPPEGTSYVPNSLSVRGLPQPVYNPADGIPLGPLPPGDAAQVTLQVVVTSVPQERQIANMARAVYTYASPNGGIRGAAVQSALSVVPLASPLLSLVKEVESAETYVGGTIAYRLTVRNQGARALSGVRLTDALPGGTAYVANSLTVGGAPAPGANPAEGVALGTLSPGGVIVVRFEVHILQQPPAPYSLVNQAAVEYAAGAYTGSVLSNAAAITVQNGAVSVQKQVSQAAAAPGDTLSYHFTVSNMGTIAVEAELLDSIPPGTLFVWDSVTRNGEQLKGVHPAAGIALGLLQPGEQAQVSFDTTVSAVRSASFADRIINKAQVRYRFTLTGGRQVEQTAESGAAVTRLLVPALKADLQAGADYADPGEVIVCRLSITNSGSTAAAISLRDYVPEDAVYVSGSLKWFPAIGSGTSGTLPPQSSVLITYRIRIVRHPHRRRIRGFVTAVYEYYVNNRTYTGELVSNEIVILLDPGQE